MLEECLLHASSVQTTQWSCNPRCGLILQTRGKNVRKSRAQRHRGISDGNGVQSRPTCSDACGHPTSRKEATLHPAAQEGALDIGGGSAGMDRRKENCVLLIAPQTFVQISAPGLFCTDDSILPGMWLSSLHRHWPKGRASQSQAILSFARVHP